MTEICAPVHYLNVSYVVSNSTHQICELLQRIVGENDGFDVGQRLFETFANSAKTKNDHLGRKKKYYDDFNVSDLLAHIVLCDFSDILSWICTDN